jgi:pentose-5-phosphate-3-epimerase
MEGALETGILRMLMDGMYELYVKTRQFVCRPLVPTAKLWLQGHMMVSCHVPWNLFKLLAKEFMTYITIHITSLWNDCEILGVCIIHTYHT